MVGASKYIKAGELVTLLEFELCATVTVGRHPCTYHSALYCSAVLGSVGNRCGIN